MRLNSKLILAGFLAIPALSMANNTSITFDNVGKGNNYQLTFNHKTESVFVGSLLFNTKGSKNDFVSFCVDLSHVITNGQTYSVQQIQTNTLAKGNSYALAGDILSAGSKTLTDANHAAAMQIAIWTAVYGSQFSLSGVSSTVKSLEQSYYAAGLKTKANALYFKETSNYGQSQITTTPEPASLAVLGIGAFGVFFRRRKN